MSFPTLYRGAILRRALLLPLALLSCAAAAEFTAWRLFERERARRAEILERHTGRLRTLERLNAELEAGRERAEAWEAMLREDFRARTGRALNAPETSGVEVSAVEEPPAPSPLLPGGGAPHRRLALVLRGAPAPLQEFFARFEARQPLLMFESLTLERPAGAAALEARAVWTAPVLSR